MKITFLSLGRNVSLWAGVGTEFKKLLEWAWRPLAHLCNILGASHVDQKTVLRIPCVMSEEQEFDDLQRFKNLENGPGGPADPCSAFQDDCIIVEDFYMLAHNRSWVEAWVSR